MKVIIGGACQGKLAFAKREYQTEEGWIDGQACEMEQIKECRGIYHFHEYVRRLMDETTEGLWFSEDQSIIGIEQQAERFADLLYEKNPEILIVANELGCGIVPMEKSERLWREACGRFCTALAARADEVVRVVCGVGQKLAVRAEKEAERVQEKIGRLSSGTTQNDGGNDCPAGVCFPLFLDLSHAKLLVAGAGKIALRRIRVLLGFAGQITVVAPEAAPGFSGIVAEAAQKGSKVVWEQRRFCESDLDGKTMVLAATDDKALNEEIAKCCRARGILVNVCSDAALCDFQFPSIVRDEDLVVGVNGSGRNHRLVRETREKIEACLGVGKNDSRYS